MGAAEEANRLNEENARLRDEIDKVLRERDEAQRARDQYLRERDLALRAEERARESLDELDAAIYECLPSDYDDDSPLDCVEHAADRLRELARERDEARAEVARLRRLLNMAEDELIAADDHGRREAKRADTVEAEVEALKAERDEARAEATRRLDELNMAREYRRGAEAMREACAAALMADGLVLSRERAANVVRALPIPEET